MPWQSLHSALVATTLITFSVGGIAAAQDAAPPPASGQSKAEFWIESGILKVIPPEPMGEETFTDARPIVELITNASVPDWKPNFTYKSDTAKVHSGATLREMASRAVYRRSIWNLEFSFKPLRMIEVDIPQPSGKMQRKNLFYLVYRVKNNGYHLGVKADSDAWDHKTYSLERINQPIFYFPHLVLQANAPKVETVDGRRVESYETKEYLDRVIPAAMKPIADRERLGAPMYDSVSITKVSIPVSDAKVDRSIWAWQSGKTLTREPTSSRCLCRG